MYKWSIWNVPSGHFCWMCTMNSPREAEEPGLCRRVDLWSQPQRRMLPNCSERRCEWWEHRCSTVLGREYVCVSQTWRVCKFACMCIQHRAARLSSHVSAYVLFVPLCVVCECVTAAGMCVLVPVHCSRLCLCVCACACALLSQEWRENPWWCPQRSR